MHRPVVLALALAVLTGCHTTVRYRVNDATGTRVEDADCDEANVPPAGAPALPDDPAARGAARAASAEASFMQPGERCEDGSRVSGARTALLVVLLAVGALVPLAMIFGGGGGS